MDRSMIKIIYDIIADGKKDESEKIIMKYTR